MCFGGGLRWPPATVWGIGGGGQGVTEVKCCLEFLQGYPTTIALCLRRPRSFVDGIRMSHVAAPSLHKWCLVWGHNCLHQAFVQ